jgi:hypothetical protein
LIDGSELTDLSYTSDPALAHVCVFEMTAPVAVDPLNNELRLHTWGNEECCLPRATTTAHVYAIDRASKKAVRPPLVPGDYLLLEELLGPTTGAAADADPTHRQVVQIVRVDPDPSTSASTEMRDRLFLDDLDVQLQPIPVTAPVPVNQTLPLVEVTWRRSDALRVPICLSVKIDDQVIGRVSVARGNIGLADHGRTTQFDPFTSDDGQTVAFRNRLPYGPLTLQAGSFEWIPGAPVPTRNTRDLTCDARAAAPAVILPATTGTNTQVWRPVRDLLSSSQFDAVFVVDVDDDRRGVLRFGDGEYGQVFPNVDSARIWYRIGNGIAGNIGADSLAHVVRPIGAVGLDIIDAVRNPLPATGGTDAETIEQVRQYAPAAFRATQFRAVTENDYRQAALTLDGVSGAVASFRWTGSWYTVFVGIDPESAEDVITDGRGIAWLEPNFKQRVVDGLTRYRLAGYDLEVRSARYVPIDLAIHICVKSGYFRGDVAHAVSGALAGASSPDTSRPFFDPSRFTFAQPVYLSRIYVAIETVEGVESAEVTMLRRHGRTSANEIENGVLPIGAWEIARLDNDPSHMENGTLTITAGGGS